MTAAKRPAKRAAPRVSVAKASTSTSSFGELSTRLRELFAKTVKPGPYAVTDKIIIPPPTKGTWERLDALQNESAAANAVLLALWGRLGTEGGPSQSDLDEVAKSASDASAAYDALFFGDQLKNVKAFSADWARPDWDAFIDDIKNYFLGRGPATGACPHCGQVLDEEQAGKGSEPST